MSIDYAPVFFPPVLAAQAVQVAPFEPVRLGGAEGELHLQVEALGNGKGFRIAIVQQYGRRSARH